MKVEDLIKHLLLFDPKSDVYVCYDGELQEPDFNCTSRIKQCFRFQSDCDTCKKCRAYRRKSVVHVC